MGGLKNARNTICYSTARYQALLADKNRSHPSLPSVVPVVVTQYSEVRQEEMFDFQHFLSLFGATDQVGYHLQHHWKISNSCLLLPFE